MQQEPSDVLNRMVARMSLQPSVSSNPKIDKLLLNCPMKALFEALKDTANQDTELPMAIIMDRRCGIERRVEDSDVRTEEEDSGLPLFLVGATPLMVAISAGRLDVVKALLAAGADPNAKTSDGDNSLSWNLVAMELLISYGADINSVDKEGKTALHNAAWGVDAKLFELLERSGANLEAVDNEGCTPLRDAASTGDGDTIKVLLKLGANQAAVDNEGRTPLHNAAAYCHYAGVDTIEAFRYNVAAFEANLTAVDKNGRTPLQVYESRSGGSSDEVLALLTPLVTYSRRGY